MKSFHAALLAILFVSGLAFAQNEADQNQSGQNQPNQNQAAAPEAKPEPAPLTVGPTAFIVAEGRSNSLGVMAGGDINLGYQFTEHVHLDIGLPLYYVRSPYSLVTTHDWQTDTLLGDPYLDARYDRTTHGFKYLGVITAAFPPSNPQRVFTTGRVGLDWFNHFQPSKPWLGVTPFFSAGAGSQTVERFFMPRPYRMARQYDSQGFVSDFEGGASYRIHHFYNVGASMYAVVPAGPQKVFSRLITPGSSVIGDGNYHRVWDNAFETFGNSDIARDNGYSGWVEITRFQNVNLHVGFTHSVRYHLDSATLSVTFDATTAFRELTGTTGK